MTEDSCCEFVYFRDSERRSRRKCSVCKQIQCFEILDPIGGWSWVIVLQFCRMNCKIRMENIKTIIMAFEFDTQSLVSNESFSFDALFLILKMAQNKRIYYFFYSYFSIIPHPTHFDFFGESRDWMYVVNVSKSLFQCFVQTGVFVVLSMTKNRSCPCLFVICPISYF